MRCYQQTGRHGWNFLSILTRAVHRGGKEIKIRRVREFFRDGLCPFRCATCPRGGFSPTAGLSIGAENFKSGPGGRFFEPWTGPGGGSKWNQMSEKKPKSKTHLLAMLIWNLIVLFGFIKKIYIYFFMVGNWSTIDLTMVMHVSSQLG